MKLKDYLKIKRGIAWKIAKEIGCAPSAISMVASGYRNPSPSLALLIEQATGGQVTRDELLFPELYDPKTQKAA